MNLVSHLVSRRVLDVRSKAGTPPKPTKAYKGGSKIDEY